MGRSGGPWSASRRRWGAMSARLASRSSARRRGARTRGAWRCSGSTSSSRRCCSASRRSRGAGSSRSRTRRCTGRCRQSRASSREQMSHEARSPLPPCLRGSPARGAAPRRGLALATGSADLAGCGANAGADPRRGARADQSPDCCCGDRMTTPYWVIVPFINAWEMTAQAIRDFLDQTGLPSPPQVLAIDNGSRNEVREAIDQWATREPRLSVWHHRPGLPSLSASWNAGLNFVWRQGGEVALVVNNDVRLHPQTYSILWQVHQKAVRNGAFEGISDPPLFVTAVGRREDDMRWPEYFTEPARWTMDRGGPDFSCFLITQSGHWQYPFDESFIPAYCEDLDSHRRYMLGGDGHRIFSVNLPYLHYASGTINQETDPARLAAWAKRIEQSRAYYQRKWGGPVNAERYTIPFDSATAQDGVTTPELQRLCQQGASDAPAPAAPLREDAALTEH